VRGKPVRTTVSDKAAPCRKNKVNRQFQAPRPNALWVSDFTYVATWAGFVLRRLRHRPHSREGSSLARLAHGACGFVLDALEQALCETSSPSRRPRASLGSRRAR